MRSIAPPPSASAGCCRRCAKLRRDIMPDPLRIRADGALDFLSLGALVHRLDPGVIPFRKASSCSLHVSGGEFNCAANLADAYGMRTGIATAIVDYPVGELIAGQVRAMSVTAFYKQVAHDV